jgi:predicted Zn-dependent protease
MTPNRFADLERRCARLKKARIMRLVFSISALFLVAFGAVYLYRPAWLEISSKTSKTAMLPAQQEATTMTPLNAKEAEKPVEQAVPAIEENSTQTAENTMDYKDEVLFLKVSGAQEQAKLPQSESQEALAALKEERRLIEAFNAAQSFESAYRLAEFYFDAKSYLEAIAWAKTASTFDTHSPKPRIIYAKAKFYTGHKQEAISALELFLSYIKSEEVEELLNFYKGQQ